MNLDDLVNAALEQQRPKRRRRRAAQLPGDMATLDLDALVAEAEAPLSIGPSTSLDTAVQRAIAREAKVSDPRPSRVFAAVRKQKGAHQARAKILAAAMTALPGQPTFRGTPGSKVVEAFTGGGLYALALDVEGWDHAGVCELDPEAVASLVANGIDRDAVPCDALTWEPPRPKGGTDLLTGGPPCTAFSKAAQANPSTMRVLGQASPKNMFPKTLDWVADLRPRVILFENSPELLTRYRPYLDTYIGQLRDLGYTAVTWELYAPDYGTPQNRRRAWVVAWPKGARWGRTLDRPPPATHGHPSSKGVKAGKLFPWVSAYERLTGGCCGGYGLVDCAFLGNRHYGCRTCSDARNFTPAPNTTGDQGRKSISDLRIGRGRSRSAAEYMLEVLSPKRPGQRRIDNANPADMAGIPSWSELKPKARSVTRYLAKAVTSRWVRPPLGLVVPPGLREFGDVDRSDARMMARMIAQLEQMSVRDAAKIQDVPAAYQFVGGRDAAFRQIGNGIAVNMGRAVAKHARIALGHDPVLHYGERGDDGESIPEGLWPTDRRDMCAAFPGVLEGGVYSAEEACQQAGEEPDMYVVPQEQRWRAPARQQLPVPQQRPKAQGRARAVAQIWPQVHDPGWDPYIDARALLKSGWRPKHATDAPALTDHDLGVFIDYLADADDKAKVRSDLRGGGLSLWRKIYRKLGALNPAWRR